MRTLPLLLAAASLLLAAGCVQTSPEDHSGTSPASSPGGSAGIPTGQPTPAGSASSPANPGFTTSPAPSATGTSSPPPGFCGPPQCSPCPAQHYLHGDEATDATGEVPLRWAEVPAAQRNASMEADLRAALKAPWQRETTQENASLYMHAFYDLWSAQNGGRSYTENAAQLNPILVAFEGRLARLSVGAVVC